MKKRYSFWTFAYILLGIVLVTVLLMTLGSNEDQAYPSGNSFAPSGTSILVELLRQEGFDVKVSRDRTPDLKPEDTLVAYTYKDPYGELGLFMDPTTIYDSMEIAYKHVKQGGKAVIIPIDAAFRTSSIESEEIKFKRAFTGTERTVTAYKYDGFNSLDYYNSYEYDDDYYYEDYEDFEDTGYNYEDFYYSDENDYVPMYISAEAEEDIYQGIYSYVIQTDHGSALIFMDGLASTNRFIDKVDNAAVYLEAISSIADKSGTIVFEEATLGQIAPPSLLETMGPWAKAGWAQAMLLFVVMVYTLGKRFGIPDQERNVEKGSRDLLDAIADTFQRSQATGLMLQSSINDADHKIRTALKLPKDFPREKRDERIPQSLSLAIKAAENAIVEYSSNHQAFTAIQRLDRELNSFLKGQSKSF